MTTEQMFHNNHTSSAAEGKVGAEHIARRLAEECGKSCCPKQHGGSWSVHCPAHDDATPSLSVTDMDGKILVKCFAGCEQQEVIVALRERGLWPEEGAGLTVEQLAEAKGLPERWLRDLGVREGKDGFGEDRRPCVVIPYADASGEERALRKRLRTTGDRFRWRSGDKATLYGLPRLRRAKDAGYVILVEGETDAWTCWHAGMSALGVPGAASWQPFWKLHVEDIERVYIWHEPDAGGDNLAAKVLADLPDALLVEPPQGIKDVNELWLSMKCDVAIFRERMQELLEAARPLSAIQQEALGEQARELLTTSEGVLDDPALLHRLLLASEEYGHVADRQNVAALHLALATAKQMPAAVIVKGVSSSGKNHLVDAVRRVWPDDLVIWRSGMSPRALVYSGEDLRHRFLVLAEAHAIQGEIGVFLLRSLISERRLSYETVIDGKAVKLEKEGPTGMVVTTTRSFLDAELETRCWTLESKDDPEYNRAAIASIAAQNSGAQPPIDERLRAGLGWLLLAGDVAVDISFARWLGDRAPYALAESKRLFERLLAVVAASAWLYQRQRGRNEDGKIVANVADYAIARGLFGPSFKAGSAGMTEAQRVVYEAVQALCKPNPLRELSLREIAKAAGKNPGTVGAHLGALKKHGFVWQEKRGGPWQLHDKPPKERDLPDPQDLVDEFPDLAAACVDPISGDKNTYAPEPPENDPTAQRPTLSPPRAPIEEETVGPASQRPLGQPTPVGPEPNAQKSANSNRRSAKNGRGVGPLGAKGGETMRVFS